MAGVIHTDFFPTNPMKTLFSALTVLATVITGTVPASLAQATVRFSDVPAGSFYEDAVNDFLDRGFLDSEQSAFRPNDDALRSEMTKLIVDINGGVLGDMPSRPSFDDVHTGAWYYEYFEEAADRGWVRGDGNCYGVHPCTARPRNTILRAETAAMIIRVFELTETDAAPRFSDVPAGSWYDDYMQIARDHCIIRGDTGNVRGRPLSPINRAEMIVMLNRAYRGTEYDNGCEDAETVGNISLIDQLSARSLRVDFDTNLNMDSAENADNYVVSLSGQIAVIDARLIDDNSVELTLESDLEEGRNYRLSTSLETENGLTFRDSRLFIAEETVMADAGISALIPLSSTQLRVDFTHNLHARTAEEDARYTLSRGVGIVSARLRAGSTRSILLTLDEPLQHGLSYVLTLDLVTSDDDSFHDEETFVFNRLSASGGILTVSTTTSGIDPTIAPGTRRPVFDLRMTASCDEDVVIEDLTIRHIGSGSHAGSGTFAGLLSLEMQTEDAGAHPRVTTPSNDNDVFVTLFFDRPLIVRACQEEQVTVLADFATTGTGNTIHNFSVETAGQIDSNARQVRGTFPVKSLEIQVSR